MAERIEGLLAAGDLKAPKILILGSMPSAQSLQKAQYYGNPRNHFWPIVCRTFEEGLPEEYEARLALAARQHIALWDSVQSCVRPGQSGSEHQRGTAQRRSGVSFGPSDGGKGAL